MTMTNTNVLLYDGYSVPKILFDQVQQQVEGVIPMLERDERYTLEMLCEPNYWTMLDDGERRKAGRCMSHMVYMEILPLEVAESKHEYPKRYRLK